MKLMLISGDHQIYLGVSAAIKRNPLPGGEVPDRYVSR